MADGAAADAAQHVCAAFVTGLDAVSNGEAAAADMVGNHLKRGRLRIHVLRSGFFHGLFRGGHDVLEEVDVVVGRHVLQHGSNTLKPHPRIDVGVRQAVEFAGRVTVKLREDEVPDFHVTVAVFIRTPRRAALHGRTAVIEDFRARTAGTGVAHHPEVVRHVARALVVADADDALGRHVDFVQPDVVGLIVLEIDGDPEAFRRQLINGR